MIYCKLGLCVKERALPVLCFAQDEQLPCVSLSVTVTDTLLTNEH